VNDLLLHVAVRDVAHLRDLIVDQLATRSEVANCETSVIFSLFRNPSNPFPVRGSSALEFRAQTVGGRSAIGSER
jgi:hypothetical protein